MQLISSEEVWYKEIESILEVYPDILVSTDDSSAKIEKVKTLDGMAKKTSEKFVKKIPEFVAWAEEAGFLISLSISQPVLIQLISLIHFTEKRLL